MEWAVRRLYGRNHTEADICNLVHATVSHFHPDRRFDKCLPSMMLRRQNLIVFLDPLKGIMVYVITDFWSNRNIFHNLRCNYSVILCTMYYYDYCLHGTTSRDGH
jgi:hypothetical protein